MEIVHSIGRRKKSIARAYISQGTGNILINGKNINDYFTTSILRYLVTQPLQLTDNNNKYNLNIKVFGGGITGQAESIRLAISRALCLIDQSLKSTLKSEGLLTRDSRICERKKYGQKKARKKFQFSKR